LRADHLVIGSGLAALSFAALAASRGRRVIVLEAHEHPGGYGHTFRYGKPPKQYAFNAQLHYVWNCGPGRAVDNVLGKLGLRDEITFETFDADGFDRMRTPDLALDIPNDWDRLRTRLAALFPSDVDAIMGFLDEVQAIDAALEGLSARPTPLDLLRGGGGLARMWHRRRATVQDLFDHHRVPPEAQTLLALQWPDFMLPPERLSIFPWVMLFCGYMRGAYYPTRHFEHVVDTLVARIRARGGEVLLQHRVVDFLFDGDRCVGAEAERVDAKGRPTGERVRFQGAQVICNMDPRRASQMIGPERFSHRVRRKLDYDYSVSNFMVYAVVEGLDLRDHGFGRSNLFHTEDPDLNACFRRMVVQGDYSRPSFAVTVPSLLTSDRSDAPEGTQIVEILTAADHTRFQQLKIGGERAYAAKKKEILEQLLDVIEARYVPGLREHLVFKLTGSPTTNERYVLSPEGNSYGSNMTPDNMGLSRLTHHSSVPGLHFCNASSGFAGFTGTIWTGARLYERLEGDPVFTGPHVRSA